jgi:hypothetical protein
MLSFNRDEVIDYCLRADNILDAKVKFVFDPTAGTFTVTDETTYNTTATPTAEARAAVQISVFDKFGNMAEKKGTGASTVINVTDGIPGDLNPSDGLNSIATVVSNLHAIKDGSIHDVGSCKLSGYYNMEI